MNEQDFELFRKRLCKQCGKKIPCTVKIDGVRRNLANRVFCLECSPWGKHNTSSKNTPEKDRRRKKHYSDFSNERKKSMMSCGYLRAQKRKADLVKMSGKSCSKCGYDKSSAALAFHHKDPKTKKFGLSMGTLSQHTWEDILEEWKKCELICANCHAELHVVHENFIEVPSSRKKSFSAKRKCERCGKEFEVPHWNKDQKFCDRDCFLGKNKLPAPTPPSTILETEETIFEE
jgi:hypothetical protein